MIRYRAHWVLPVTTPPIADGIVAVDGEHIVWVGPAAHAPDGETVDLGDALLLPGFVNAHTHLDLHAFRGLLTDVREFFPWVGALTAAKCAVMDPAALLESARAGVAEGLSRGITTYADTADNDTPFTAMLEAGVRGIAFREVFGPDPAQRDASLTGLRDAIAAMRTRATRIVAVGASPHAPYSVSDELFAAVADWARHESLPVAVHIAESAAETELVRDGAGPFADFLRGRSISVAPRGRSPIDVLDRAGVLWGRPLLIHCVRVDDTDIAAIAHHDCGVALCPNSNAWFKHGRAPVAKLVAAGIRVGIGSDSMASNMRMDVRDEACVATSHIDDGRDDWPRALELATIGGARALGLADRIGSLDVGKDADLVAFPSGRNGRPSTAADATRRAVVGLSTPVLVTVAGRELVSPARPAAIRGPTERVGEVAERLSRWRTAERPR